MNNRFKIREATQKDSSDLFKWRNDKESRKASFNEEIISWENHRRWFKKAQKDESKIIYIASLDGDKIGTIRFEFKNNFFEISVIVNPKFRNKSYGASIISQAISKFIQTHKGSKILAQVKKDNLASIKVFQRAGFIKKEEDDSKVTLEYNSNLKFGLKLWSTNTNLFEKAKEAFNKKRIDFIELTSIADSFNKISLEKLKGVPVIIHCQNANVDLSKKDCLSQNRAAIKNAQKFADFFESEYIIIHPGYSGKLENTKNILNEFKDPRFCIENMPGITVRGEKCIGNRANELKTLGDNFCLDFAHAIKAAVSHKIQPHKLIKDLLILRPKIFHFSDGNMDSELDEHLNIGEGDFDFKKLLVYIDKNKQSHITLETPKENLEEIIQDIKNIEKLRSLL
jgi:deoxyribonuclease IV